MFYIKLHNDYTQLLLYCFIKHHFLVFVMVHVNYSVCEQLQRTGFFPVFYETGLKVKTKKKTPVSISRSHIYPYQLRKILSRPKFIKMHTKSFQSAMLIFVTHVVAHELCLWVQSLGKWEIPKATIKIRKEVENVVRRLHTSLQMGKREIPCLSIRACYKGCSKYCNRYLQT